MAFDKYVKLAGSERQPMPGAKKAGACDPNEQMQVTIVLRERQPKSQHPSVADLVASGERISRTEYEARYGADPQDIKTVEAFAKAHGLPVKQTNPFARSVSLDGTAGAFAEAFQVELSMYEIPGGSYRGRTGALSIPTIVPRPPLIFVSPQRPLQHPLPTRRSKWPKPTTFPPAATDKGRPSESSNWVEDSLSPTSIHILVRSAFRRRHRSLPFPWTAQRTSPRETLAGPIPK
jgi:hypothetical protein